MTRLSRASGTLRSSQIHNPLPSIVRAEEDSCRRPIEQPEVADLRVLGRVVRALRFDGERLVVNTHYLSLAAQLRRKSLWRIETGIRRTRRSTLRRLAKAAARLNPSAGTQDEIFDRLIEAAGNALAPPSKYQFRVDRRRLRRYRRRAARKRQ